MCAEARISSFVSRASLVLPGGLWLVASCFFFTPPALATPNIQHWRTHNGTRVYFVATHELPIIDIQVVFDAGSARDPADRHGLALLTGSLLDEGAGGLDANAVGYEFEKVGAIYSSQSDQDSASVSLRSLAEKDKLGPALANFARVLADPDFPDDAIERQRRRLLIGIQQKQQSPGAIAGDLFNAALYGDHPYAHPGEGTEDSVQAITRDDVLAFHRQHYAARNAIIAIVGDLAKSRARSIAAMLSGALPGGARPAPLPPVAALNNPGVTRLHHPSAQMHILVGQPGMKQNDPDYFPLYVGNHVLGGAALVSRLFEEVRERRGLSYSAYSSFSPQREDGPFTAGLQTRADQAEAALEVLRETLKAYIEAGPTADELLAAKQNLTGGFPLRLSSNRNILGYVALIGFYELPLDYLDSFTRKVEAVSADQIRGAFRRRLDPDRMATIMVGPIDQPAEESGR